MKADAEKSTMCGTFTGPSDTYMGTWIYVSANKFGGCTQGFLVMAGHNTLSRTGGKLINGAAYCYVSC